VTKANESGHVPAEARLESIFRRHYPAVAAYVRRRAAPEFADDVVAETFFVAWRRLDDVPDDALPWLLGVARKTLATQRRAATRRRSLLARLEDRQSRANATPPSEEFGVASALTRLREKDREAITLIAWDGLTPTEAAAVLGLSPLSFRVRLHRARRRLRLNLETQARLDSKPIADVAADEMRLTKGGLRDG
jgi:RNA polymerase sigma-70 factor, ECF subfamily